MCELLAIGVNFTFGSTIEEYIDLRRYLKTLPSKAVKKWLQSDDAARQKIVASYFVFSPIAGWEDIGGEQLPEVKVAPPTTMDGFMGKFQAAVGKWAVNGDPMFVVTATKM